jgi:tetratricopeptide (TPR) repeat protein
LSIASRAWIEQDRGMQRCGFGVCLLAGAVAFFWQSRASACGWDWETFAAEASRLPCVSDVIVGAFGTHTEEYYEATIEATEIALAWAPNYAEALDAQGLALVHLGRYEEAKPVLLRRAAVAPDAYPSHANLGTLYTFTGDYELALGAIDEALKLEPQAHFGREKYHRKLVEFLRDGHTRSVDSERDFLGLELTDRQRFDGTVRSFEEAGLKPEVFDAVAAMIAVYGAENLPDLYVALGDVLALRGEVKLAWAAYRRAQDLGHPAKERLARYTARLWSVIGARITRHVDPDREAFGGPGGYRSLAAFYAATRGQAADRRRTYHEWERAQLRRGLRPWVLADVERTYRRMDLLRERCKTPGIFDSEAARTPSSNRTHE